MNSISVEYSNASYHRLITKKAVVEYINKVLAEINRDNVELSVSFVSEDEIHQLNKQYRNIDRPTDILSFAATEDIDGFSFITAGRKKTNIGDMVICPEIMAENAKSFHVSEDEELHRLLIHGILHLTGENHLSNEMSEPMLIKQEAILGKLTY